MVGGAGLYANAPMVGLIVNGTVYLKVGASNAAMFERDRCEAFTYQTKAGKRSSMSYRCMPERLYDDPEELAVWAGAALSAAQQSKSRVSRPAKASEPGTKAVRKKAARKR